MSLKQFFSAGIMVGVFALAITSPVLVSASDKTKDEKRIDGKSDPQASKEKPQKAEKPSPWESRPMIPSGPKF